MAKVRRSVKSLVRWLATVMVQATGLRSVTDLVPQLDSLTALTKVLD